MFLTSHCEFRVQHTSAGIEFGLGHSSFLEIILATDRPITVESLDLEAQLGSSDLTIGYCGYSCVAPHQEKRLGKAHERVLRGSDNNVLLS